MSIENGMPKFLHSSGVLCVLTKGLSDKNRLCKRTLPKYLHTRKGCRKLREICNFLFSAIYYLNQFWVAPLRNGPYSVSAILPPWWVNKGLGTGKPVLTFKIKQERVFGPVEFEPQNLSELF